MHSLGLCQADKIVEVATVVRQMPDLEDLFYQGGTLLLKRTKFTTATLIDHDSDDDGLMPDGTVGLMALRR